MIRRQVIARCRSRDRITTGPKPFSTTAVGSDSSTGARCGDSTRFGTHSGNVYSRGNGSNSGRNGGSSGNDGIRCDNGNDIGNGNNDRNYHINGNGYNAGNNDENADAEALCPEAVTLLRAIEAVLFREEHSLSSGSSGCGPSFNGGNDLHRKTSESVTGAATPAPGGDAGGEKLKVVVALSMADILGEIDCDSDGDGDGGGGGGGIRSAESAEAERYREVLEGLAKAHAKLADALKDAGKTRQHRQSGHDPEERSCSIVDAAPSPPGSGSGGGDSGGVGSGGIGGSSSTTESRKYRSSCGNSRSSRGKINGLQKAISASKWEFQCSPGGWVRAGTDKKKGRYRRR